MAQFVNMRKVDLLNGEPAVFSLRQLYYADQEANKIGAIVYMGGEPYALAGTCTGTAIRADGTTVPMQGTVDGNQAYITLIPDCYAIEGSIQIFVKITIGDVVATLAAAVGTVRLTETEAVIDPGEIIPSVSALITAINDAVESIPADYSGLLAAIAPNYTDLVFPVSAGTWCWHGGGLYRAAVDIPATETWTAAHWSDDVLSNTLAADIKNRVSYAAAQTLTETQQETARDNIGAADQFTVSGLSEAMTAMGDELTTRIAQAETDLSDRVAYSVQVTSDSQKARARSNIGAAEQTAFSALANDTELYSFQLRRASIIEKAYVQWESGGLNSTTGADSPESSDRQIRSGFLLAAPGEEIQFTGVSTDRLSIVCSYDKNKDFIAGSRKSIISGNSYTLPANTYYVRFIYGFTTGAGQTVTGYGGVDAVAADWNISCESGWGGDITDVQVDGVSVVADGVANIPFAKTSGSVAGVVKPGLGLYVGNDGTIVTNPAGDATIKDGTQSYYPLTAQKQHESTFYGLAKAAGADMASSSNPVGTYTDAAKSAIQTMLGISGIIAPVEDATASKPYAIGDAFLHGGALYKASSAIAAGDAIVPGTNCAQTTIIEMLKGV